MKDIDFVKNKSSYTIAMSQGRDLLKKLGVDLTQVRTWHSLTDRMNIFLRENGELFFSRVNALPEQEKLVLAAILFAVGQGIYASKALSDFWSVYQCAGQKRQVAVIACLQSVHA